MYSLIYFSDDELRQARKLRFILLNMDFKWLVLLSFVVHLWPKLNVIKETTDRAVAKYSLYHRGFV